MLAEVIKRGLGVGIPLVLVHVVGAFKTQDVVEKSVAEQAFVYEEYIGGCCAGRNELTGVNCGGTREQCLTACKAQCDSQTTCVSFEMHPQVTPSGCSASSSCVEGVEGFHSGNCGHDLYIKGAVQTTMTTTTTTTTTTTAEQASSNPSVVGDPHLTNLRGEKFDIHDGMHRLVHFPRGAHEDEALLMVDVKAVDFGESDCYSVYLQSVKISGKWVGEEVNVGVDIGNSSAASLTPRAFAIAFAETHMDWPSLAKQQDAPLMLKGSMPVTVTTGMRMPSGQDAMGGEAMTFKIGDEHSVFVQVWSSHAKNKLTHDKEVRYLNMEVQNLPKNSGGIIGLDHYSRPSTSRCGLIQAERDLAKYIETDSASMNLLRLWSPQWTASASSQ